MALNWKQILALVVYGLICFFGSLLFVQCSAKSAQNSVNEATARAEAAEATVNVLQDENARLRDTMARANNAVERALDLILEAQAKHEDRIDLVEHDPAARDWLTCDIPDSVREAFADYYSDRNSGTP